MNQILITKKLYITPELKRKKKIYQFYFIFSIFLVVSLTSLYIYAEVDRVKDENISKEILGTISIPEDTTVAEEDALVFLISDTTVNADSQIIYEPEELIETQSIAKDTILATDSGYSYMSIGTINIPKINVTYPIIDGQTDSVEETEELLKIAPTKFWGPDFNKNWGEVPNKVGNLVIAAHNYRNEMFFSKVPTLVEGDLIEISDLEGNIVKYSVYSKTQVDPADVSSTSQNTNGRREITLITCTDDNIQRIIIKARAI